MDRDELPEILRRLERHRLRHGDRGLAFRVLWTLAGFVLLAVGLAMVVLPGPAVVVIPLALAMLSFEFAWAERVLHVSIRKGLRAKERAASRRRAHLLAMLGLACAALAAAAAVFIYL